ncbi:MAG TPA: methylmalonyl-CoA epimerase, partial [Gammaproteobacteria bacterium]|nr:methylmalonyl-CoA epimerase [Gammaproteobacteria bacterium]
MIRKISHIGIAVENLEGAKKFFEDNFSLPGSEKESFGELLFSFISFEDAGARLELLQSTTDEGQMA